MDLFLYLTCLLALFKVRMHYVQKVSKLNNIWARGAEYFIRPCLNCKWAK